MVTTDVEIDNVLDLTEPFRLVRSETVTAKVEEYAAAGYRWVVFYEGVFEGTIVRQYVYLGDDELDVSPA